MAFGAAPLESGGDKFWFLTTDGNAIAGLFAVDTGSTTTGSNTVGFQAVATHVEGDAVGSPGGLSTTSVPVVLVAGDDGTNAVPLQLSGTDLKITLDNETVVLGAGSAAFGKLAANSGVDIGDVDITSIVPGTSATSLGKAEDAVHGSGNVGVMALAVRDDTPAGLAADGDYIPLTTDSLGRLWTHDDVLDAALDGSELQVDIVAALPAGSATIGEVTIGTATTAATDLAKAEDVAHGSGDVGIQMLAVRKSTPVDLSGADGDYEPLQLDNGRLWVSATVDAALPAGTNAIGKLAANSGVDIGDVDVASVPAPLNVTGGGTEAAALRVTLANNSTGLVSVDDNGGALTVDWAGTAPPIGAGTEAAALRVTLATDSTGLVSVDDGGGNISIDDGGNSITVDGNIGDNGPGFTTIYKYLAKSTTADATLWDPSAGKKVVVTDVIISISGTATDVNLAFGAGTTLTTQFLKFHGDVRGGLTHHFRSPIKGGADENLNIDLSAAQAMTITVSGYEE